MPVEAGTRPAPVIRIVPQPTEWQRIGKQIDADVFRHHRASALVVGIVSAVALFIFIFIAFNKVLAIVGVAGLVIASLLNVALHQRT